MLSKSTAIETSQGSDSTHDSITQEDGADQHPFEDYRYAQCICSLIILLSKLFIVYNAGDRIQGLLHARQMLYYGALAPAPTVHQY